MTKVTVKEKFNTSLGSIITVTEEDMIFSVGDEIYDGKTRYLIKAVSFANRPETNKFSLIVDEL